MIGIIYSNFVDNTKVNDIIVKLTEKDIISSKDVTKILPKIKLKKARYNNQYFYIVVDGNHRLSALIKEYIIEEEDELLEVAEIVEDVEINLEEYFELIKIYKIQDFIINRSPNGIYDEETFKKYDKLYNLSQELKNKTSIKVLITLIFSDQSYASGAYLKGILSLKDDTFILKGEYHQVFEGYYTGKLRVFENKQYEIYNIIETYKLNKQNKLKLVETNFNYEKIDSLLYSILQRSMEQENNKQPTFLKGEIKCLINIFEEEERYWCFEDFCLSKELKGCVAYIGYEA